MTTITRSTFASPSVIIAAVVLMTMFALPAFASASTYAYVDQSGNVRSTESGTWQSAITTAPNIDQHSGVMLLTSLNGSIMGTHVNGF